VLIGDHIDLTTREFNPIERPEGCAAEPGSATDLASEPAAWLLYANYHRWSDVGGCEVRVDVISQTTGPEHCGWESATFITIGTSIGAPHSTSGAPAGGARTYIWDPGGALLYIDGIERNLSLPVEELPDSVMDTEFRDGDAELWLEIADRYVVDEPRQILCA